jgi:hypothetical protein
MNILDVITRAFAFVSEGLTELFAPTHDEYPETGVQPFSGDPKSNWRD